MRIAVQQEPFDPAAELRDFGAGDTGAIVTFVGVVRDNEVGDLETMEIEHYPGMTEAALAGIAEEAERRWSLGDVMVIHRYGGLKTGERIMMVATAARHRKAAFEAAEYLMDYLKSRAPFWKKEITRSGAEWVAAKADDEAALDRW
ncbi:molybdenum cofactor biosynthesis protein MoaE [Sedimentitalea sp. JM2-8]|uniref:Molybdopterin synthase catalytic subunit n=1 Tax=Sedimentitalea xiamensis TaxID=3050037 RepID=A0ABT7FB79_9RHOB|nr:molybdenum cofactor biosynthesis protein MoaE [Sedimentitalea xiamensis]MDK3072230.1 molybdenum cofactor biosynthesis protein MoaE [Sedimentitalea xiamensis]